MLAGGPETGRLFSPGTICPRRNIMYAIHAGSTDPFFNLALEETLFESLCPGHPGMLLAWRNAPSIIVGRHQNTAGEIDQGFCARHGIRVVRRPTGGGAVYHDLGNINFSFLCWAEKNRIGGFEEHMRPMVRTLRELGVEAEYTSRNDITVNGRKVAGTAQMQKGQKMLHHGCLLVDVDFSMLGGALRADPEKFRSKGVDSHRARVANLREFLPPGLSSAECMGLVTGAMLKQCAGETMTPDPDILREAGRLADTKYRTWAWTWGNSPRYAETRRKRFPWGRLELFLDVRQGIISGCRFCGDFFAARDVAELEAALAGQKADAASLRDALSALPVESWFIGAEREPLLEFLCGNGVDGQSPGS